MSISEMMNGLDAIREKASTRKGATTESINNAMVKFARIKIKVINRAPNGFATMQTTGLYKIIVDAILAAK